MKKLLTIILLCFISLPLFSQSSTGGFTILLGSSVGKFTIDAGSNFNSIYSNRKLAYTGVFGLGNGSIFIICNSLIEMSGFALNKNVRLLPSLSLTLTRGEDGGDPDDEHERTTTAAGDWPDTAPRYDGSCGCPKPSDQ